MSFFTPLFWVTFAMGLLLCPLLRRQAQDSPSAGTKEECHPPGGAIVIGRHHALLKQELHWDGHGEDEQVPPAVVTVSSMTTTSKVVMTQMEPPVTQVVMSMAKQMGEERMEADMSTMAMADAAQPIMTAPTPVEVEMLATNRSWSGVAVTPQEETT
jgi:hypothetical protein